MFLRQGNSIFSLLWTLTLQGMAFETTGLFCSYCRSQPRNSESLLQTILSYKLLLGQPVLSQNKIQNGYTCIPYIHLIKKYLQCLSRHSTTWQKCSFVIWKENCAWSLIWLRAIPALIQNGGTGTDQEQAGWGGLGWAKEKHWNEAAMHTCSPKCQSQTGLH